MNEPKFVPTIEIKSDGVITKVYKNGEELNQLTGVAFIHDEQGVRYAFGDLNAVNNAEEYIKAVVTGIKKEDQEDE